MRAWRFWNAAGIPLLAVRRRSNSAFRSGCLWVRTQRFTPASAASWRTESAPVEAAGVPVEEPVHGCFDGVAFGVTAGGHGAVS